MKVVLAALNAKYVHSNLAIYDLEAYTRKQFEEEFGAINDLKLSVKEYTINNNMDAIMQSIYKEKADVVAFSCYIWNISEILTICRDLKKVAPKLVIWLGGPEVSYNSEKLLKEHEYIDGVICGEGEAAFCELVKLYVANGIDIDKNMLNAVMGITYREKDGSISVTLPHPLISMDDIPFIYEDLSKFENKILYYESSRGCPFSCSYCLSSIDKSVRFRNLTLVKNEISFFMKNKVKQVKFIDRTFNCDKKRARQIWSYIQENDNGITNFHFEIAADLIEDEDLRIFEKMRPGLIQLEIGLQSTNDITITEIRRVMDIEILKNNMLRIRKMNNIHQHLDLIAGLPYEDYDSFVKSFNMAFSMKPNQLQLGFLKVLKGSYMEEKALEYGLIHSEYEPYEVLATKWMSYDELLKLKQVEEMVEVYYNSDQFEHVLAYMESFFETPFLMFKKLGEFYETHELFGIGFKREARYEALRSFYLQNIANDKKTEVFFKVFGKIVNDRINKKYESVCELADVIFDDLLTFDYYCRENAKSRPSWRRDNRISKEDYNNFFKRGGTDELILAGNGYDSKQAARAMHIETVTLEALSWIDDDMENVMKNVMEDAGFDNECDMDNTEFLSNTEHLRYVVYNYDKRDPLSGDASYNIISHL